MKKALSILLVLTLVLSMGVMNLTSFAAAGALTRIGGGKLVSGDVTGLNLLYVDSATAVAVKVPVNAGVYSVDLDAETPPTTADLTDGAALMLVSAVPTAVEGTTGLVTAASSSIVDAVNATGGAFAATPAAKITASGTEIRILFATSFTKWNADNTAPIDLIVGVNTTVGASTEMHSFRVTGTLYRFAADMPDDDGDGDDDDDDGTTPPPAAGENAYGYKDNGAKAGQVIYRNNTPLPMTGTTSASANGFNAGYSLAYGYVNSPGPEEATGTDLVFDVGTIRPSDKEKEKIWLVSEMFSGTNLSAGRALTSSVVRNSKMDARVKVARGSQVIDSYGIKYDKGAGYIEVKYIDKHVSTKGVEFEYTVYLVINGKRYDADGQGVTLTGELANSVIDVFADDDYVDTSLGEVAAAQEFVPAIEVDLGQGVLIQTKFFKDKKYYGTASREPDDPASTVFAQYPDVDSVVILSTVGLSSSTDRVVFEDEYAGYYVYDNDLNYLGMSSDKLPVKGRYYLANKKLDIVEDFDEPMDEPVEEYDPPAETGGGAVITNANANPGTGC